MLFAKHAIISMAGMFGGVFGYVSADSDMWALVASFVGMFACACIADFLTQTLEENEDGDD